LYTWTRPAIGCGWGCYANTLQYVKSGSVWRIDHTAIESERCDCLHIPATQYWWQEALEGLVSTDWTWFLFRTHRYPQFLRLSKGLPVRWVGELSEGLGLQYRQLNQCHEVTVLNYNAQEVAHMLTGIVIDDPVYCPVEEKHGLWMPVDLLFIDIQRPYLLEECMRSCRPLDPRRMVHRRSSAGIMSSSPARPLLSLPMVRWTPARVKWSVLILGPKGLHLLPGQSDQDMMWLVRIWEQTGVVF